MRHTLTGRLDMSTCGAQARTLATLVRAHAQLELDFSQVDAADSAALALILELSRQAQTQDHILTLCGLSDGLKSLAALYGVDNLLKSTGIPIS